MYTRRAYLSPLIIPITRYKSSRTLLIGGIPITSQYSCKNVAYSLIGRALPTDMTYNYPKLYITFFTLACVRVCNWFRAFTRSGKISTRQLHRKNAPRHLRGSARLAPLRTPRPLPRRTRPITVIYSKLELHARDYNQRVRFAREILQRHVCFFYSNVPFHATSLAVDREIIFQTSITPSVKLNLRGQQFCHSKSLKPVGGPLWD